MRASYFISRLFVLSLFISVSVMASQAPVEQTLAMINALKQVKQNNEASYRKVDTYIDYDALAGQSIAPHRNKFTDAQAHRFSILFKSLIRKVAYPQSSVFYNDAKVDYASPVIDGDIALVLSETYIEKEDFEMEIGYQFKKNKGVWRLSDLVLDEDSLVKDYQNQFGRLILKVGVEGLIKKIENKIDEINNENKKS